MVKNRNLSKETCVRLKSSIWKWFWKCEKKICVITASLSAGESRVGNTSSATLRDTLGSHIVWVAPFVLYFVCLSSWNCWLSTLWWQMRIIVCKCMACQRGFINKRWFLFGFVQQTVQQQKKGLVLLLFASLARAYLKISGFVQFPHVLPHKWHKCELRRREVGSKTTGVYSAVVFRRSLRLNSHRWFVSSSPIRFGYESCIHKACSCEKLCTPWPL